MSKVNSFDWKSTLLIRNASIRDAINNLENTGIRITLIVDENDILLGTVTDGDIRRALLKGSTIETKIVDVMHNNPVVAFTNTKKLEILELMRQNKIYQIPIIDDSGKILGLHLFEEINKNKIIENPIVIMAGGFGTRLRPYTNDCPKPMVLVSGKPILEHIILRAKDQGFKNFYISLHYLGHVIKNYFGNGERWNINIIYIDENQPLGTAGAISLLDPFPNTPFIITNGDIITSTNYSDLLDFHIKNDADATMSVFKYDLQNPYGVVVTSGLNITDIYEKPIYSSYVNAGIYVLNPSIRNQITTDQRIDMPDLFKKIKEKQYKTIAYPIIESWLDVGRPDDLNLASELLNNYSV